MLVHSYMHTEFFSTLYKKDGTHCTILCGQSNHIVKGCGILIASLMSGSLTTGITYWALGSGEGSSWDTLTDQQLDDKSLFTLTQLYNEVARTTTSAVFLDTNNIEVVGPTNRIEVRATFNPTFSANIREIGLFGGTATSSANSGTLIDHKTHAMFPYNQTLGNQDVLINAVRLTF